MSLTMLLSAIVHTFESEFLAAYKTVLPSQLKALSALKQCRTTQSPVMMAQCHGCDKHVFTPHSCGHRNYPNCQHHESQQWLDRQRQKQVPAGYFLLTFTLPEALRLLAWQHQRTLYVTPLSHCPYFQFKQIINTKASVIIVTNC